MLPIGFETGDLPGEFRIKENQLGYYPKMTPEEAEEEEKKAEVGSTTFCNGADGRLGVYGGKYLVEIPSFSLQTKRNCNP